MKVRGIKIIVQIITLSMLLSFMLPLNSAYAEKTSDNKVRVGWYELENFQHGSSDDEIKHGYGYEYLQNIANYTGWEYEYVYGNWAELYDMFLKGEIDIMGGMSFTEERGEQMLFPDNVMGNEVYYIYKRSGDNSIDSSDIQSFNGKRIGTIRNNLLSSYFVEWKTENELDCVEVEYDSFDERTAAFFKGELDCIVAVSTYINTGMRCEPVMRIASSDYYLAVSKKRMDLLIELNKAQLAISERIPFYISYLQNKYYEDVALKIALSKEEKTWLDTHSYLRVGFVSEYLPFSDVKSDGKVEGVITDVFENLIEKLGIGDKIKIEYVPFESHDLLMEALQRGIVDAAFPIADSIWMSEKENIAQTASVFESSVYIIYKGEFNEESVKNTIAISSHSAFQRTYAEVFCPESEVIVVNSAQECLDAVLSGRATCTFFNSGRGDKFLSMKEYSSLNFFTYGDSIQYCIGVKKGNNALFSLIERGACVLDKSSLTNAMYKYIHIYNNYSIAEFVHENALMVLLVLAIIIVAILVALFFYIMATSKEKKHKKELEAALRDAKQANRAKTAFLFNMSHDIRTPMNAIIGFTDLLEKNKNNAEKITDYVKKIQLSNNYLLSLINSVLEMARIESGVIKNEEVIWDVQDFNEVLYSIFEQDMEKKHITFTRTINIKHTSVYCDPTKLREIFLNIISNAFKYTDEGGKVHMALDEIQTEEEGKILFRTIISDNGRGMSKEFLPTIFDEFTRAQSSTDSKIEGTGLGMAITKKLVDILGGSIEVESELGVGTTFTIIIPHRVPTEEELKKINDEKLSEKEIEFKGRHILLAEDNELNREIAVEILTAEGFVVDEAFDGQMAVDMVLEHEGGYYDAVLMDIQMPNLNGYEASKQIRKLTDSKKASVPIIAMTANAFDEDKQNAYVAGMNAHLPKPLEVSELMGILEHVLDRSEN
ncbi:MAG: transporter substrate-binding domain-containing protein [Lachnospiraceae bacterium]|nr:transporter substrate-binding domain-containing protein [Lachnospiraceae bacterium]